jgi:hypothetical protein
MPKNLIEFDDGTLQKLTVRARDTHDCSYRAGRL